MTVTSTARAGPLLWSDLLFVILQVALFKAASKNAIGQFTVFGGLSLILLIFIIWKILTVRGHKLLRIGNGLLIAFYLGVWGYHFTMTVVGPD
jgi:hypothetical protein